MLTITFRLSNFEHGERSHQSVHNIRDLNGLLLYILCLGYWFFFLVLYHCGPRWLVGGEWIYSLSIYREISYSGVFASRFSIFHCHDMRVSVGKVGLLSFLICPKEQFYKFCRVGRFFCFTVQGVMRWFSPSSLSCTGQVGHGAGYFWWTCVWISISYLKRDPYIFSFCLIGRERQLFWIRFCVASVSCRVLIYNNFSGFF